MLFRDITIIDEGFNVKSAMNVIISDGVIQSISESIPDKYEGRIYDGRSKVLMPGFFNAHAHSPMTLMRGYGENMNLQDWLFNKIFPYEAHLTGKRVYAGTMLSIAESLRNGIVSTADMYYFCEDMIKAYIDTGAKVNVSRSLAIQDDVDIMQTDAAREAVSLYNGYEGAEGCRIKVDMSLHAEYTNCDRTVAQLAELTSKLGSGMHVHVSETRTEVEECYARHGASPVKYLAEKGLFDNRTTAAHLVWIDEDDIRILKEKSVDVATNPVSNLKLASGVCNIPALMDAGLNIAIGTDSVSSNNSLDMIEEMKIFAIAPKMYYNTPSKISALDALKAATRAGALAQGRHDTGLIKEGYRADLIVLDISGPHMHPLHSLADNIVYSASSSDVVMTMVDGNVLYENGEYKTIDIEKVIYEADMANGDILAEIQE